MEELIIVTLGGYKAFTRGAAFWDLYTFAWGYTLATYAVLAGFLVLIGWRLLQSRIVSGYWSWGIPLLVRIDLTTGATSMSPTPVPTVGRLQKWLDRILDPL